MGGYYLLGRLRKYDRTVCLVTLLVSRRGYAVPDTGDRQAINCGGDGHPPAGAVVTRDCYGVVGDSIIKLGLHRGGKH
jgi:hypothetical protein